MKFTKMHGAGNDYIYVNGMKESIADESAAAIKLSDRHFGIGGDGLIIIKKGTVADYEMVMYNADGSRGAMCGNGIRCVAKYLFDKGYTNGKTEFTVESMGAVKHITVIEKDCVAIGATVDMGKPILKSSEIPVKCDKEKCINEELTLDDRTFHMTCVSMGNPHGVIFVKNLDEINVASIGYELEHCNLFPQRANIEFAQILSPNEIKMRVWERGSGETLACGTGACAVIVAGALTGKCSRKATIHLLGGDLDIEWNEQNNHVYMTGPATTVFEGTYTHTT